MACDKWGIIVHETTTNLVTNPSFETGTTNWTNSDGTASTIVATRVATYQRRGTYSAQLVYTYGAGGTTFSRYWFNFNGGTSAADTNLLVTAGNSYTLSYDIYALQTPGAASDQLVIYWYNTTTFLSSSAAYFTPVVNTWIRASLTAAAPATANRAIVGILMDTSTHTVYLDGVQFENKAYDTTYVDGDLGDGYAWTGTAHASTSTRTAQARNGGREYMIESDYGLTVRYWSGIGMPPIRHLVQAQAILPGAQYTGYHVDPRPVTLLIAATNAASLSALHGLRDELVDAIKPDLTSPDDQPVTLRYYGANASDPVELYCYYESGLDFQQPEIYRFDQIPLRFIAYDPFWYRQGSRGSTFSTASSLNTTGIVGLVSGSWQALGGGVDLDTGGTAVYALAKSQDASIFAGGKFGTAGSTANARSIAKWNQATSTWATLNGGVKKASVPGIIYGLQSMPDGSLYVGGSFNTAGATAMANFGKWSGSAWAAVGSSTAINSTVRVVKATTTGVLYIGGSFTNANSQATADALVQWNRSAYASVTGSGGANGTVHDIAIDPATGYVYACGTFTQINGVTTGELAYFNGSAWAKVGGAQPNGSVYALAIAPNGDLYAYGAASSYGSVVTGYLARYNGAAWEPSGAAAPPGGAGARLYFVDNTTPSSDRRAAVGELVISTAGAGTMVYNGSTATYYDLGTSVATYAAIVDASANLYIGYSGTATSNIAGAATTVTNAGSARSYPVIKIKRSGGTTATLSYITNATTGKSLWFSYSLQDGETLTIDTRLGYRNITSSAFGQVWRALLRNSDFSEFYLQPGANTIRSYISTSGTPTITATLEWQEAHWSPDTAV